MKPLVDGIKPPKMPKKKKEGLVSWIKSIAGIETEEKKKPAKTKKILGENRNKKKPLNKKSSNTKETSTKKTKFQEYSR